MKRFVIGLLLILIGIGLLAWVGIGQYIAQIAYDGQYIKFRIINDVSLWGFTGFAPLALGCVLLEFWRD